MPGRRRPPAPHDRRAPLPDLRDGGLLLSLDLHAWFGQYLDDCNRHDLAAIRAHLHPDVRRTGAARGADAWIADVEALLRAFPDYRWKRIAVVVEGDRLAAHLRTRGTHRGDFHGRSATGRRVSVAEFAFYRVVDGRIAEYAGTADDEALSAQLDAPVR